MVRPGPLLAAVNPGGVDPHVRLEHETAPGVPQKCDLPSLQVPFGHEDGLHGVLQLLHLDFHPPGCHVRHLHGHLLYHPQQTQSELLQLQGDRFILWTGVQDGQVLVPGSLSVCLVLAAFIHL